jgi:hypothetical protein
MMKVHVNMAPGATGAPGQVLETARPTVTWAETWETDASDMSTSTTGSDLFTTQHPLVERDSSMGAGRLGKRSKENRQGGRSALPEGIAEAVVVSSGS